MNLDYYFSAWCKVNKKVTYWGSVQGFLNHYTVSQIIRYKNLKDYLEDRIKNKYGELK